MVSVQAGALARGWQAAGVLRVFGVPGGGPNLDMIGAAEELGIPFVLTHAESSACVAAGVFGRLTGTCGVAIVTRGPGFTSALTGLAQASLDGFPLVLVSDTVGAAAWERTAHQRLDQVAAAAPLAKWSARFGVTATQEDSAALVALASAEPAGGVHVAFDPSWTGNVWTGNAVAPAPDAPAPVGDLAAALEMIRAARRPVVLVGPGARCCSEQVRRSLAGCGVPAMTTYHAKGVLPDDWPDLVGSFTGVPSDARLLAAADLIVGMGLDPVELMPGPWPYEGPVLLFSSMTVEAGYFGGARQVVGPLEPLIREVGTALAGQWPAGHAAGLREEMLGRLASRDDELSPQAVVAEAAAIHPHAIVTVDAGAHMLPTMLLWPAAEPDTALISNGLATMGFALPAAIGAGLARPDRRVLCFVGDGGLGMVAAELETLARLDLDVTVVVFNDSMLSLIKLKQGAGQGGIAAVGYQAVDYAAVATGFGVRGVVVTNRTGLRSALDSGPGPLLIDARIDASGYPNLIKVVRG